MMRRLVFLHHQFFIDVYTKPCLFRKLYISIGKYEIIFIRNIIQYTLAYIIMNSNTLFLNNRIMTGCIYLNTCCQCDRT